MKTQAQHAVSAMLKGWQSTRSLIDAHAGLTPLARLSEWRDEHVENMIVDHYPEAVYRINGKMYREVTREKKVTNFDGVKTKIIERRFQRVK